MRPTRIAPPSAPDDPAVGHLLEASMPPGVPPILLFGTFAHNLPMTRAMRSWGSYELRPQRSLSMRDREIVIDRTRARCACECESGLHLTFFAERLGLSRAQVKSLTAGSADDACWVSSCERLLIRAVDALHDHAALGVALAGELLAEIGDETMLDLLMLCGWCHAISSNANDTRVWLANKALRRSPTSSAHERSTSRRRRALRRPVSRPAAPRKRPETAAAEHQRMLHRSPPAQATMEAFECNPSLRLLRRHRRPTRPSVSGRAGGSCSPVARWSGTCSR